MKFIKTSFIPDKKITLSLVDNRITNEMENTLNKLNIKTIKTINCKETYNAISCHPDIFITKLDNENMIVCPNLYKDYKELLSPFGFNIIKGDSPIEEKYPHNVQYNVAILGNKAIHNFKYTDKKLLGYLDKNNFEKINVNQGYCKCSICIVDENSIITSDEGIYNEVITHNIDCLLIEKGHIDLFDLNYGFIGGCSGLISEDTLAFFGNITKHPDYEKINDFVTKKNKKIISLSEEKLLDLGSLIPLL